MKQQFKIKIVGKYQYNPNDIIGTGTWGTVYKAIKIEAKEQSCEAFETSETYFKTCIKPSQTVKTSETYFKKQLKKQKNNIDASFTQILDSSSEFLQRFHKGSKMNNEQSLIALSKKKDPLACTESVSKNNNFYRIERKRSSLNQLRSLKNSVNLSQNNLFKDHKMIQQPKKPKNSFFAIKKINKFKIQSSEASYENYLNQVISLQRATNIKQVIQFTDFFRSKSYYYIVTEYFQGSIDLYSYMQSHQQKFTETEVRQLWRSLLIDICHRDLKLQNVLYIPQTKQAKIIDFGLALCFPDPQTGVRKVGSPLFMSPQILLGQSYTYKCDIWSLGIIFYYTIVRASPYGKNPSMKKIEQQIKKLKSQSIRFPKRQYVSEQCRQVIEACLKWEEKQRMQIEDILKLDFFDRPNIRSNHSFRRMYYQPDVSFTTKQFNEQSITAELRDKK